MEAVRGVAAQVWKRVLDVERTVIEAVDFEGDDGDEVVVVRVRPTRSARQRCSRCDRRAAGYDVVAVVDVGGRWIWER